jgi:hypothetical protein
MDEIFVEIEALMDSAAELAAEAICPCTSGMCCCCVA